MNKTILFATVFLTSLSAFAADPELPPTNTTNTSTSDVMPYAQPSASRPTLELRVGPSFSTVSSKNDPTGAIGSTTSINAAAEFDLPVSNGFSIVTGLDFIQKGFGMNLNQSDNGFTVTGNLSGRIQYLELPVLAKLNFGDQTRFSLFAGPYAAIKLGTSTSGTMTITMNGQTQTQSGDGGSFSSGVSTGDAGLRGGASALFPIDRNMGFVIEAAYDFGLVNIDSSGSDTIKNRALLASVGLGIAL